MNCQDISLALDDRDIGALSEAQRRGLDAHLGTCPDCALDWQIHQRMLAAPTPSMPATLPAQLRVLAAASAGSRSGRPRLNRFVLLGVVLAVGAAAAMLITRIGNAPAPQPQTAMLATTPTPASAEASDDTLTQSDPKVAPATEEDQAATSEPEVPVKPFTVRVLPLENGLKDPSQQVVAALLYDGFLERLRKVPGLTLLEPEHGSDPEARPEFRITITSAGSGDSFGAHVKAEVLQPDGVAGLTLYFSSGAIAANCVNAVATSAAETDPPACVDPGTAAANMVRNLRTTVFPPDSSLRRRLQSQVGDRTLSAQQRLQAMLEVSGFGRANQGPAAIVAAPGETLRDPVLVQGAVDLATNAVDPQYRAGVWSLLRGAAVPGLARPLLNAFRQDPDGEVRLAALGTLAADFGRDARVQAAFDTAAQKDASPLIRALAQRSSSGFAGDAAWRDYVIASLKDTNRSAVERVEALFYHMGLPVEMKYLSVVKAPAAASIFQQFDHEAIRTLLELLPVAATESTTVKTTTLSLMNDVIHIEDPAVTDMMLASLEDRSISIDRPFAVEALLNDSRRGDPRVRAALEKIGADDPDPRERQLVTAALQKGNSAADNAGRPRFGARLDGMEASPFVPPEFVGKSVVSSVTSGSVAQKAGVLVGDVLLEVNGVPILKPAEIARIAGTITAGTDVEVVVYRSGEKVSLRARF